jgi:hypothetical protein
MAVVVECVVGPILVAAIIVVILLSGNSKTVRRRARMFLKAVLGGLGLALSIWVAVQELGIDILHEPAFLAIIFFGGYIFVSLFIDKWYESTEDSTSDKIDRLATQLGDLIQEIKLDRESREKGDNPK